LVAIDQYKDHKIYAALKLNFENQNEETFKFLSQTNL